VVVREIKSSDAAIEVVDVRCPNETRSKKLESMMYAENIPFWIVMNKVDLVPKNFADLAKMKIKNESNATDVVHVSTKKYYGFNILKRSLQEKLGTKEKVKVVVVGFPNVGKSSLINMLSRRSKAGVAPKPGFTRGKQWIRITKNILVSDTPGVMDIREAGGLWRKVLFPSGEIESAALFLLDKIKHAEGNNFSEFYKIKLEVDNEKTLEKLALRFNFIGKGNKPDIARAAKRLIDDWNACKLVAWWL
jgi:hypothetical protein